MKRLENNYWKLKCIKFIAVMGEGAYAVLTYLLVVGTTLMFLVTKINKNTAAMYVLTIIFQIVTIIIIFMKIYNDTEEANVFEYIDDCILLNIVAMVILFLFNMRTFMYFLASTFIIVKLVAYINNVYMGCFSEEVEGLYYLEDIPVIRSTIVLLIPLIMFETAIFLFLTFPILIKIIIAIMVVILTIIVSGLLYLFL